MAKQIVKVDRLAKAKEILALGEVKPKIGNDGKEMYRNYVVKDYDVDLNVVIGENVVEACTCPDHVYRGALRCKHILAGLLYEGQDEDELGKSVIG